MTMPNIVRRLQGPSRRRLSRWLATRPFTLPRGRAIVSFTFDDFPRSAADRGGAILERYGVRGTYYASLGLAGSTIETGELFRLADIPGVLARGHELGCHTFDHLPAWETDPLAFEDSIDRNATLLARVAPTAAFATLSYPISNPRPETKRRTGRRFLCCRGGGQTFNAGVTDLNCVSAFFLEQARGDLAMVQALLRETFRRGAWLIFATHDIAERPTRFGCTPGFFETVVASAVESGADVLPVAAAYRKLLARASVES